MNGDGYVTCHQGHQHWGRFGAAGILLSHTDPQGQQRYFLQHRAPWVMEGNTWGTPGGAMNSDETPHQAALRELQEEIGEMPGIQNLRHIHSDDHGGWAYHTVTGEMPEMYEPDTPNDETQNWGWFTPAEIDELPLHSGFRRFWDAHQGGRAARAALPSAVDNGFDGRGLVAHWTVTSEDAFVAAPSIAPPPQISSPAQQTQMLDSASLSSIAHNLHYRFEAGGLDPAAAKDYASRLLKLIGYPQDEITILAAVQAWQQLYPGDDALAPKAPAPEATTPTQSFGYGTHSRWQPRNITQTSYSDGQSKSSSTLTNSSTERTSARSIRIVPWAPRTQGKFSIDDQGQFHHWQIDDYGNPHHAQVAQELGYNPAIDGEIDPRGGCWSTLDWPGYDHEALWSQAQLPAPIRRHPSDPFGYLTKVLRPRLDRPVERQGVIVNAMTQAEHADARLAVFGVDQERLTGQGKDAPGFFTRSAAEGDGVGIASEVSLEDVEHLHSVPDFAPPHKRKKRPYKRPDEAESTVPSEVNGVNDHWPEFGERPYDEKHHYDVPTGNDSWRTADWTDEAVRTIPLEGGGTFHPVTGEQPTAGYQVALGGQAVGEHTDQHPEEIMADPKAFAQLLHAHHAKHGDLYGQQPDLHVGAWVQDHQVWLEPSENVLDFDQACQLGTERNQEAIWDVVNKQEIDPRTRQVINYEPEEESPLQAT